MIDNPTCPVCGEQHWRLLGSRTYRLVDIDKQNPYVQRRFRVLFEIWFRGADEVLVTSRLCESCGFVLYTPRPSADDLDAKYRFLTSLGADQDAPSVDSPIERQRARLLFRYCRKYLPSVGQARILDFGGGDGRLMGEFVARGHHCFLVDYYERAIPGVDRLGTILADIPAGAKFDLIVCSHVIEHVANPLQMVSELKQHLDSQGILYVEVPMEVWGRDPLHEEPVTHVNFFTPSSLRLLLERAGMSVFSSRLGSCPYPGMRMELVIRAGAMQGDADLLPVKPNGSLETERFLRPDLRLKVMRRLLMPSTIPGAVAYKIRQLSGKF